jgi:hypothetical protein
VPNAPWSSASGGPSPWHSYFDGAALAKALIVLAAWVLIGVLLLAVVGRRGTRAPSGAVGSR